MIYLLLLPLSCSRPRVIDCSDVGGFFEATYAQAEDNNLAWAGSFDSCQEASFRFAQQGIQDLDSGETRATALLKVYLWEMPPPVGNAPGVPAADIDTIRPLLASNSPELRQWSAAILKEQRAQDCGELAAAGLLLPGNSEPAVSNLATLAVTSGPLVDCGSLIRSLKARSLAPDGQAGNLLAFCAEAQHQSGLFVWPENECASDGEDGPLK